jgi:hypothetical protein
LAITLALNSLRKSQKKELHKERGISTIGGDRFVARAVAIRSKNGVDLQERTTQIKR